MAETVQVHFTLEGEGLSASNIHVMYEKSTWIPTWHTINYVL